MSRSRASCASPLLYSCQRSARIAVVSFVSGTGMRRVVDRAQPIAGHVRVDLRGRKIGVAKELLYDAQVSAAFEQVRRVRVSQCMRMQRTTVRERMGGNNSMCV